MKALLFLSTFVFGFMTFAGDTPNTDFMSKSKQMKKLEDIAKDIRQDYWVEGYEDVSSQIEFLTKANLDDYYEMNKTVENPLDTEEISQLYRCYHQAKCELYLVSVSSSFYGGYGSDHHYILLDTPTGKHDSIRHNVYAE